MKPRILKGLTAVSLAGILSIPLANSALASASSAQHPTFPAFSISEFPAPGTPRGIAVGSDGALWFTEFWGNKIGRMTTAGGLKEFAVPTPGGSPYGITVGSDGALWFTELWGNKIGRITIAGSIAEFPIPTPSSWPNQITAGPDGALWFTETFGNRIGRVTTGGAFSEFYVPSKGSRPEGITVGPDKALWFTERAEDLDMGPICPGCGGNKIGRLTTGGSFSEFKLPLAPDREPIQITAGSDGALWFTEGFGNRIGRITTAGSIAEFPLPTALISGWTVGRSPYAIAAGSDGALWFTENPGGGETPLKIGRITTAGGLSEFPVPTSNTFDPFLAGITTGPDGALWFTENTDNKVGRLTTGRIPIPRT